MKLWTIINICIVIITLTVTLTPAMPRLIRKEKSFPLKST